MLTTKNTVNKFLSRKTKRYLCLYVELTNHRRVWYRASPKIEQAVKMTDAKNVYQYLNKHYINVPLRIYWGHNRGIIGVGKIIKYRYLNAPVNLLCTRSQFVDGNRIKHVLSAYHYLRHDYRKYSRLNIFVDLCYWKRKEKRNNMNSYDQNLANINEMLTKVSNNRHVWTIGVNKLGDGVHYYLAIEDANSDDKRNVVELLPSKADKDKHIIKLHCDNYDIDNMSGLEAGELAGILQISAILLLSVDYGYTSKGGTMNIKS